MWSRVSHTILAVAAAAGLTIVPGDAAAQDRPFVPVGIYLGSPEEGARLFTAERMFPTEHPSSGGHEYPTAQQFHSSEVALLLRMGELVGLRLHATLMRHPSLPSTEWSFDDFSPPPEGIESALDTTFSGAHVAGVRVVTYVNGIPIAFLVDTRSLTLQQRGMGRATSSGLDVPREEFLAALLAVGRRLRPGNWIVVFDPLGEDR